MIQILMFSCNDKMWASRIILLNAHIFVSTSVPPVPRRSYSASTTPMVVIMNTFYIRIAIPDTIHEVKYIDIVLRNGASFFTHDAFMTRITFRLNYP